MKHMASPNNQIVFGPFACYIGKLYRLQELYLAQSRTFALCIALVLFACPRLAFAQLPQVMVKTTTGCSVATDAATQKIITEDSKSSLTWEWTGDCAGGAASGAGVLRQNWKLGAGDFASESISTRTGQMHQGRFYGFSKFEYRSESNNSALRNRFSPSYAFEFLDQSLSIGGLGLIATDAVLDPAGNALASRGFDWSRDVMSIGTSKLGSLVLMKTHCGLDKNRFPECGFGEGQQKYDVFRFTQRPPNNFTETTPDPSKVVNTYCPDPRDRNSCSDLAAQLSKPYVEAIEAFLVASLPKLTDIDGQVRSAGAELAKRRSDEAAAKAQAAERAAQDQAKARADFDAKIDAASVGELFALADEFKSKGGKDNTQQARAALRKLISRFPEHKLAALSAQMLTEMQSAQ